MKFLLWYQKKRGIHCSSTFVPVNSFKHKIFLDSQKDKYFVTTVGKIIFNEILPDTFPYVNEPTSENIEGATPSKYFIEYGENLLERLREIPKPAPFAKGTLEKLIRSQTEILVQTLQKFNQNAQDATAKQTNRILEAIQKENKAAHHYSDIIEEGATVSETKEKTNNTNKE